MRQLIVSNIMTLDGYYSGLGGDLSMFPRDEAFDRYNVERLRTADTVLLGGSTYMGFSETWPSEADYPDTTPTLREYARLINPMRKVVVSDSLTPEKATSWGNTRIVCRIDRLEEIVELKRQPGKDIVVFGSQTLWRDLLAHGLVDELHLMISSFVLGAGIPLFDKLPLGTLQVSGTQTWEGSGSVLVRYAVQHQPATA